MIIGFWSPKGGCGVSVFAASCAVVASRRHRVMLVDCAGDQAKLFGLSEPELGVRDWLAVDTGNTDSLARIAIDAAADIRLVATGTGGRVADEHAGTRLAAALRARHELTIIDLGRAEDAAVVALGRVLDHLVMVTRPCYLAFHRALGHPLTPLSRGVVLHDEPRALGARDLRPILGLPLLASFEPCPAVARSVDGGMLAFRVHESLARPVTALIEQLAVGRSAA